MTETTETAHAVENAFEPAVEIAAPAELEAIGRFLARSYEASFAITPGYRESLLDLEHAVGDYEPWVVRGGDDYLGAVLVSRPGSGVGSALVADPTPAPDGDVLTYRFLGVAPQALGQGVARLLVAAIEEEARRRGARLIAIWSGPQMTAAHRLYESSGYVRQPELETLVVDGGQRLRRYHREL